MLATVQSRPSPPSADIVYDVHQISQRLSPDDYISAAISLYLDIVNLFLHILRILAEISGSRD